MTRTELMEFVKSAELKVEQYGWQDRNVYPYSFPVKVTKVLDDLRDYDKCTRGSQDYLKALAEGLKPILEAWEESAKEPRIKVKVIKTGRVIDLRKGMLEFLLEMYDKDEIIVL